MAATTLALTAQRSSKDTHPRARSARTTSAHPTLEKRRLEELLISSRNSVSAMVCRPYRGSTTWPRKSTGAGGSVAHHEDEGAVVPPSETVMTAP